MIHVGAVLAAKGLPVVLSAVRGMLGAIPHRSAEIAASAIEGVEAAVADREITPAQAQAAAAHLQRMEELRLDGVRADNDDRKDARAREAATGDRTPRIIAFAVLAGFFAVCLAIVAGWLTGALTSVDALTAGLVGTILGYVSAKADQVVSYYFGSSAGSAAKQQTLDRMALAAPATAPPRDPVSDR